MSAQIDSNTKIPVYELQKNGASLFGEFMEEIEHDGNLFDDLAKAIRIVEETSNLKRYPKKKFRKIENHNLTCKIYEAKANIIRVYLFHEEGTGRIIVAGGVKNDQKKDIKSVVKTIKAYQNEQTK